MSKFHGNRRGNKKDVLNFMNSVAISSPKRSVFDLTHDVKLSCNMGELVPTMVFECVPGEKFNISNNALVRFAPLVSPVFHRNNVTFHTWAVPYRILWENYGDYFREGVSPLPAFPTMIMKADGTNYGRLADYLGVPKPDVPNATTDEVISVMRFAAYACIWDNFYRDQNLQTELNWELTDGDNSGNLDLFTLRKRAWRHDYFTSNLPFAQKGAAVEMPFNFIDVPVKMNDATFGNTTVPGAPVPFVIQADTPAQPLSDDILAKTSDLQGSSNINEFRLAYQLQRYVERAARAGNRLVEWIKSMFDTDLPDYTAQIPQYIGGSISPVQISEVLQTSATDVTPQGNMAGRGIAVAENAPGSYYAREHCVIMTLMCIQPETAYQQGLDRDFLKVNDPKEFLNPMFANLGEQETYNSELMAFRANGKDTFGYLPRYAEYRTIPNRVAGDFRTTLNYWTEGRIFDETAGVPALNANFIECDATHRIFADTDEANQKMYVHTLNRVRGVRPLPKYGTPSL